LPNSESKPNTSLSTVSYRHRWLLGAAVTIFAADQITKAIVRATLEPHMRPRFDTFFHFTHQLNRGIVGGAFSGYPWVAWIAPVIALAVFVYLYRQVRPETWWQQLAFGMVLGGAIGNIADRVMHGGVTDFLQFHLMFLPEGFPWRYYPAFNIADSGIVVGMILLILTWRDNEQTHVASTPRTRTD
jgi:signal peptidase II